MWVVEVVDVVLDHRLDRYGIEPRDVEGLDGIVAAPFLHVGFGHLLANTIPFVVMGVVIALEGAAAVGAGDRDRGMVSGLGTWLVAPAGTIHVGASGIVFGYASYLIARGIFNRRGIELAVGVVGDRRLGRRAAGRARAAARHLVAGPPVRRDRRRGGGAGAGSARVRRAGVPPRRRVRARAVPPRAGWLRGRVTRPRDLSTALASVEPHPR